MRGIFPRLLVALVFTKDVLSSPAELTQKANVEEDVLGIQKQSIPPIDAGAAAGATNSEAISDSSTTFNGLSVPPMKEMKGDAFDTEAKDGYW